MLKQLTIKDRDRAPSVIALKSTHKKRELLPEAVAVVASLPETHPDPEKPKIPLPKPSTYLSETLGPYISDQLSIISGEKFSPELKTAIIEFTLAKVAGGKTIAQVAKEEGLSFPDKEVLYNWIMRDKERAEDYQQASEMSVEAKVDSLGYDMDTDPDLDRVKLKVKFTQWYAAKKKPKEYGESKHLVVDQRALVAVKHIKEDMSPDEAARVYMENFTSEE